MRGHFAALDYTEVETPVLVATPALEDYIDAVAACPGYLRTSPELHMKRLMAQGLERIYQLGSCFRAGEHGLRHRVEFTMLEWYHAQLDYVQLRDHTTALLRAAAEAVWGQAQGTLAGQPFDFGGEPEVITVHEAYARFAGESPEAADAAGRFDELMVSQIEPQLGRGRPTFLVDYPIAHGALARAKADDPSLAERWELYLGGIEIANAYGELIDPAEQRRRFLATADLRRRDGRPVYPLDDAFLAAMPALPPMAGCALGLDRLLMALVGADDIAAVRAFDDFPDGPSGRLQSQ